jgi:hypothetical protein
VQQKTRMTILAAAAAGVGLVAVPTVALADDGTTDGAALGCARKFDQAQRTDMESFRDFDKDTWVAGHDDDAVTIFTSGQMVRGRDAIAAVMSNHFTRRNAEWSWTELHRAVDGCRTATIVYDATYAVPSANFTLREIVSVTYTYKDGVWLSVIDQGTTWPA